jgi:hypothetical protein
MENVLNQAEAGNARGLWPQLVTRVPRGGEKISHAAGPTIISSHRYPLAHDFLSHTTKQELLSYRLLPDGKPSLHRRPPRTLHPGLVGSRRGLLRPHLPHICVRAISFFPGPYGCVRVRASGCSTPLRSAPTRTSPCARHTVALPSMVCFRLPASRERAAASFPHNSSSSQKATISRGADSFRRLHPVRRCPCCSRLWPELQPAAALLQPQRRSCKGHRRCCNPNFAMSVSPEP